MADTKSIEWITASGLCTGCGLCAGMFPGKVKIALRQDGYLRPVANAPLSSAENAKLFDVCPGALIQHEAQQHNYHPHWSPLVHVRTGPAIDPTTRHEGSSGGVLSALLIHLLESKPVDLAEREGRRLVVTRAPKSETLVKRLLLSRVAALWQTRRLALRYVNFPLVRLAFQLSLWENISSFKGTLRRLTA